jgi:hypothetical protein
MFYITPSSFARGAWVLTMGDPRWDPQWDTEWDSHTTSHSTWNNISFPRMVSLTNYVVTKCEGHRWRRLEIVKTTTSHISANIRFHVTGDVANISGTMRSIQKCNKKGIMTSSVTSDIFCAICRRTCQVHSRRRPRLWTFLPTKSASLIGARTGLYHKRYKYT